MIAPQGDSVLVGVSGGSDSMALLHALCFFSEKMGLRLGVSHVNHGIRGKEGDRDAEFVRSAADSLSLPYYGTRVDVPHYRKRRRLSLEEAAREVRYQFFREVCEKEGYQKLALGHHRDDNAELMLMNLIRGSGPLGLSGIPATREGWIIRPLIRLGKSKILAFLQEADLSHVLDRSNTDTAFMRNRIRHQLLPELTSDYNPGIVRTLERLSRVMRDEENWAAQRAQEICQQQLNHLPDGSLEMAMGAFSSLHPALQRRIVRMAVKALKGDLRRLSFSHVEAVLSLPPSGSLDLPGGVCVFRSDDMIGFVNRGRVGRRRRQEHQEQYAYRLFEEVFEARTFRIEALGAQLHFTLAGVDDMAGVNDAGQRQALFDMNQLQLPLVLRNVEPGDRFQPLGLAGNQKVKKFFIDHKIPREKRFHYPVLVSNEKIVWLVGLRIADSVKVTPATKTVLRAEVMLED